jgi:hypothetical protein
MTPEDKKRISKLSRRAAAKFDELCVVVAAGMGFNTDPNKFADKDRDAIVDGAERLIEDWDERLPRLYAVDTLNILLREHWELCDQIWRIRDADPDEIEAN